MQTIPSKLTFIFTFYIFNLLFLASCATKIEPEKPLENYTNKEFKTELSNISVPIEIDLDKLNQIVNKNISGLIYEDNDLNNNGGDNMLFKIYKHQNFTIHAVNDELLYTVPLKVWLKAGMKTEKMGVSLAHFEETNFIISIDFKSKISIDPNYKIITQTEVLNHKWIEKPTLKVGILNIPLNNIVDLVLKSQKESIGTMIDQQIKTAINIKKYLQDTWVNIQNPIAIPSEIKSFLKINPSEIILTPLSSEKGKLKTSVGIKAFTEFYIGDKAPQKTNTPLPALKTIKNIKNDVLINLTTDLLYEEIIKLTKPTLLNQNFTFNNGKKNVKITNFTIYGSEDKMIIKLDLIGSLKGAVYLTGKPKYDATTQTIFFDEMDYDIKTKNIVMKSANWLAHDYFVKVMQPYFKYSIAKQLKDIQTSAQKALTNYNITNGIVLKGIIKNIDLSEILIAQNSIKTNFKIKGNVAVKINDL